MDARMRPVVLGLGWFSVALGLIQLVAPDVVARRVGMAGREGLLRAYGVRDLANGIGLLTTSHPAPWMWARVAGDALDVATLRTVAGRSADPGVSMAVLGAVMAADVACATALTRRAHEESSAPQARDYSDRSGLPQPPAQMRGAARADFETPADMQLPSALKPYTLH
jgi:hypothetical protein